MMYCTVCGTENPEQGRFCSNCGARIGDEADSVESFGGLWNGLFDFSFSHFITRVAVQPVYIITVILYVVLGVLFIIGGFQWDPAIGALYLFLVPLAVLFLILYTRIWLELFVNVFQLSQDIREVKADMNTVNGEGDSESSDEEERDS